MLMARKAEELGLRAHDNFVDFVGV
jgi:hypothetical protein